MIKVGFKKIAALLLMLALILTVVPFAASAAEGDPNPLIETGRTGSITVTKYATADNSRPGKPGTGMSGQTPPANSGYSPLKGATFKLFKIADATKVLEYYNGTSTTTYDVSKFQYNEADGTATYDGAQVTAVSDGATTNENGVCTFSSLAVGIYVLKEVTAPDQITTPLAEPCFISIPMVNTETSSNNDNKSWMYDVHVYPKNHASTGTVELTKVDQNDALLKNVEVEFELSKKEFLEDGQFATEVWKPVTVTTDNAGTSTKLTLTLTNGKLTVANLPSGLYGTQYKLVEVSASNGYIVNKTPLYFKVNNNNTVTWNTDTTGECQNKNTGVTAHDDSTDTTKLSITLRNERPSLTKQVEKNGGGGWETDEQYRLDDEITYRLTVYVPNNVAELGTFEIKDVPEDRITDSGDSGDYTVTYGNSADACNNPLTADNYTLTKIVASGNNGQGFKLELNPTGKALVAGKFIQIVYKAHMNANAVIAGIGNGNTATLTYSKYIGNTDTSTYAITDEARVYTYQFQITKYKDSVKTGNEIGNVQFKLLDSQKSATTQEHVLNVVKVEDGVYRLALAGETTGTTDTLTTKSNGTILIQGLENGTYYLKETKTIDGYNLLSAPFAIRVNVTETTKWTPADWQNGTAFSDTGKAVKTYDSTTYAAYGATDPTGTSTIINKKGFVLPQTGGMGYLLFCTVGIVLIAGGAMLIFGGRKKKIR